MLSAITARFGPNVTVVAGTGLIGASLCPDAADLLSGRRLWQRAAWGQLGSSGELHRARTE